MTRPDGSHITTSDVPRYDSNLVDEKYDVSHTEDALSNTGKFSASGDSEDFIGGYGAGAFVSEEERQIVEKFDKKRIDKLRLKIDFNLIPACSILYLLCFLDRGNIGNAKIAGLTKDLNMSAEDYSVVLVVFFATYCSVEGPTNMLLKKLSAKIFLPLTCFCWGICILGMGFAKSKNDLIALRVLLGLFEAGLMPGCAYYLSNWYRSAELSYRVSIYFSSATIAGAFSGILAWAIMKMDGIGGRPGWSWIFILEGLLTLVVAFISYFILYPNPHKARFLSHEEAVFWEWYIRQDPGKGVEDVDNEKVGWKHIKDGAFSWRVWYFVIMSLGCTVPIYSFAYFLPTIIVDLGWTASTAQLMSAPPYIWACIVTIVTSYFSDRLKNRAWFVAGPMIFCAIPGFAMALGQSKPNVTYGGVFLATAGQYAPWPSLVTWNANNFPNAHSRGIAMGVQIGFASAGGVISAYIYRAKDSPRFKLGHGLVLGFTALGIMMVGGLVAYYHKVNLDKEKYCREHPEVYQKDPVELAAMGVDNPLFRYTL